MGTVLAWVKALTAFIPVLVNLAQYLEGYIRAKKIKQIEEHYEAKDQAISHIETQIAAEAQKEQPNEEELKELHRRLMRIVGNNSSTGLPN